MANGDIRLPNEKGRSPTNPAPELVTRRIIAANKPPEQPATQAKPTQASAFSKAAEGFKTLQDKGLINTRKMSR